MKTAKFPEDVRANMENKKANFLHQNFIFRSLRQDSVREFLGVSFWLPFVRAPFRFADHNNFTKKLIVM